MNIDVVNVFFVFETAVADFFCGEVKYIDWGQESEKKSLFNFVRIDEFMLRKRELSLKTETIWME